MGLVLETEVKTWTVMSKDQGPPKSYLKPSQEKELKIYEY